MGRAAARRSNLAVLCSVLAVALTSATDVAAEPLQGHWLTRYDVAPGCPTEDEFRALLEQRLGRAPELALGGSPVAVHVAQSPHGERWRGDVQLQAGSHSMPRSFEDSSCSAVVHAIALVTAFSTRTEAEPSRSARSKAHAMAERAITDEAAPPTPSTLPANAYDRVTPLAAPAPSASRLGVSALAVLHGGLAPEAAVGVGIGLSASWLMTGYVQPWVQLSVTSFASQRHSLVDDAVRARFDAVIAGLSACPLRLAVGRAALRACAEMELGQLDVSGSGAALERSARHRMLWAAAGASLRGEIELWRPLAITAAVGPNRSLTPHEFYFTPDTEAFQMPSWSLRGIGALRLHF